MYYPLSSIIQTFPTMIFIGRRLQDNIACKQKYKYLLKKYGKTVRSIKDVKERKCRDGDINVMTINSLNSHILLHPSDYNLFDIKYRFFPA